MKQVLVLNCGSSSIKYQLIDMATETTTAGGRVERIGMEDAVLTHERPGKPPLKEVGAILDHAQAMRKVLGALTHAEHGALQNVDELVAVGHRVVHGGEQLTQSVLITPEVEEVLHRCIDLAPLHNPPNLIGIAAARALMPKVPQVAVFDTAFHHTMPARAYLYALPYALYHRHGVRRYGFHGTSHRYVTAEAARHMGRPLQELKLISCHLGNGASVAAVDGGRSIDTSMGFTPLEGLVMGTRAGDLDAGIIAHVMAREELSIQEVNSMLNKHSGLRGISGISGDMRQIEEAMAAGDDRARLAFEVFCYRLLKYIGAYAAVLGGVDAVLFTGGIGENSVRVREWVGERLAYLGARIDLNANRVRQPGARCISLPDSRPQLWVVPTNEELVIARDALHLVSGR
jgi:acetate kinase